MKFRHYGRAPLSALDQDFNCAHCGNPVVGAPEISGVNNRNHCPYCLWSRHLDLFQAGDRLAACRAPMRPVGLSQKQGRKKYASKNGGELLLVHICTACEQISLNRLAADDLAWRIEEVFAFSQDLNRMTRSLLDAGGVQVLGKAQAGIVSSQLFGK